MISSKPFTFSRKLSLTFAALSTLSAKAELIIIFSPIEARLSSSDFTTSKRP